MGEYVGRKRISFFRKFRTGCFSLLRKTESSVFNAFYKKSILFQRIKAGWIYTSGVKEIYGLFCFCILTAKFKNEQLYLIKVSEQA